MGTLIFGETHPCYRCHGAGEVRRPKATKEEAREQERRRARAKARGEELPRPPAMIRCPDCAGTGYLMRTGEPAQVAP